MRTSKAIVGVALALAFFALCNATISFFYEPYGSRSDITWSEYSKMESLDTVIVGTSLAQHGLNPDVLDKYAGTNSFNLATPSQSLEDSLVGIQTAYEDHGIKRAVLGLSRTSLTTEGPPSACSPFLHLRGRYVPFSQTFSAVNMMLWRYGASKTETSINWLFPWVSNHVKPSISNFVETAQAKINHEDLIEACEAYDPGWKYVDRGHGSRRSVLNYNSKAAEPLAEGDGDEEGEGDEETTETASSHVDPDRANTIRDICAYCAEHDIELVVISLPLPLFNVIDPQADYFGLKHEVDAICAEQGVAHYDFNLASPELFDVQPRYFYDSSHFNLKGARVFSRSFGKFLAALDAGRDVSAMFLSEEERVNAVDEISLLMVDDTVEGDGLHLHARPIAGPSVEAEYQFFVRWKGSDTWQLVRDWSTETDFTYVPDGRGTIQVHVNARKVGTDVEYDRYREITELV